MSENIGLKITLGGVTQVVSDIDKLKGSIDGAKKTLEGLEEGTEAFQQLSQEIEIANIALSAFEQTASEMDAPQKMTLLQQAGKLVGAAFQSANQTLKQFGIDTEKIGRTATNAFNSVRKPLQDMSNSLEETGKKLSEIPGPIGQVAQGVRGLGQAMKILLANPVVAFLAAIVGALTLLYKAFTSTKAGGEQMERIFAALGAVVDVLRDRFLKFADSVGKLFTGDLKGAVMGFRDSVSGIGQEIVKEAQEAAKIKGILQDIENATRNLNKERARQNVLIAESRLRLNDESIAIQDRLKALEEVKKSELELASQEQELAKRRFEAIKQQNELSDSSKEALDQEAQAYIEYQNKILQSTQKQKEISKQEKTLRDRQRAEQKQIADERLEQLKKQQEAAIKTIDIEIQQLEKLKKVIGETVPEPSILTDLRELLSLQEELSKMVKMTTFEEDFVNQFTNVIPPVTEAANTVDKFGSQFLLTRRVLAEALYDLDSDFSVIANSVRDQFSKSLQLGEITKPAFDALMGIVQEYENVRTLIGKEPLLEGVFDPQLFFELVKDFKVANGEIIKDVEIANGQVSGTTKTIERSYTESLENLQNYIKSVQPEIKKYLEETVKDFDKLSAEQQSQKIQEYSDQLFQTIETNVNAAIKEEQRIISFFDEATRLQTQRQEKLFSSQLGFILSSSDKIVKQLTDIYGFQEDQAEIAFDEFVKQNVDTTNLTEEQLDQLTLVYQTFYEKLNQLREQNTKQEKTSFEETMEFVKNLQSTIQEFQGVLNSFSQLQSEFYTTQLQELEIQNQRVQDQILGDTEQAQKKRLEAEQIYQEKVKQLQKEQTISGLKLDLTQALANTAQAITATFAAFGGTPAAFISNAIIAGINSVQVGLIQQQIAQAQTLQRGGIIKGQGGLVVGPSHEYGGVKFQGGGIELEGGETVVNRVSSVRYNDLLNQINVSGGGRPLVQNNFDDSRIVEAIARQRSEPIRAYVLESEISNKQGINRRLEQLSSI